MDWVSELVVLVLLVPRLRLVWMLLLLVMSLIVRLRKRLTAVWLLLCWVSTCRSVSVASAFPRCGLLALTRLTLCIRRLVDGSNLPVDGTGDCTTAMSVGCLAAAAGIAAASLCESADPVASEGVCTGKSSGLCGRERESSRRPFTWR